MGSRWHIFLGVILGLAISAGVLWFHDRLWGKRTPPADGPLMSESSGTVRRLVIHYATEGDEVVAPVYHSFLRQLPARIEVYAVCPGDAEFQDLLRQVGPTECTLTPVLVGHAITSWSRDRWLPLGGLHGEPTTLLCPRGEDGATVWPAREGDQRVADDLAAKLGSSVRVRHSDLYFDGGDFSADNETVFVRPNVLLRNLQRTVATRAELIEMLSGLLKRKVVVLDGAPDHHIGMYLMPVGNRTVLLGDPKLGRDLLAQSESEAAAVTSFLPGGPDFSEAGIASFEAVAEQCRSAGYRVVRIPIVPSTDGRTYITFINGILDERDSRKTVYMPSYSFAPGLNRAATAVWNDLGYEVRPVECDSCAPYFGTLHCLVNVLARD